MSIQTYISDLPLASYQARDGSQRRRNRDGLLISKTAIEEITSFETTKAAVDVGSVMSFVDGLTSSECSDILFSVQLAQRAASAKFDRFFETRNWYRVYVEVLENIGWATEQFSFARHYQHEGDFRMDKSALEVIAAIASQQQLAIISKAVQALESAADGNKTLSIFEDNASDGSSGNFQLGSVQKSENHSLSLALGAYFFHSADTRKKFLFFSWGGENVNFWVSTQRMTLNRAIYDRVREIVKAKLSDAPRFISEIEIST